MLNSLFKQLSTWEQTAANRLSIAQHSPWQKIAALGAHLGDGLLWTIVAAGLLIWGTPIVRKWTWTTAIAVLLSTTGATAVKYVVRRKRPQERGRFYSQKYDRYSFPSGHATRMAAIAIVAGHAAPRWALVGYLLTLLVALCRVMVGVHYPSDVLTGLLIGLLGGWSTLTLGKV